MHKIKLFSGDPDMYGIQKLQNEINQWLEETKTIFSAMVVHSTDMIEACGMVIYSIYYTFLPNEIPKDGPRTDAGAAG